MRKMAKEAETSPRTMRRVVKNDLKMSPYKLQKRQLLSGHTIEKRVTRNRLLLNRIKEGTLPNIIFSDEKLFSVVSSLTITKMTGYFPEDVRNHLVVQERSLEPKNQRR